MKLCKRILAALALVLAAIVLLLSLAVGVGVWVVKGPVTARATHLSERIDAGLDLAEAKLDHAQTSLATAAQRLENVKAERRQLPRQSGPGDLPRIALARTVQRTFAPELGDAQQDLHAVAEAAVVINSVLADLGNLPFLAETGLDMDQLEEINSRIAGAGPAAWELSRLLGEAADPEADAQMSRVEQLLSRLRELVAACQQQVKQVRQRTTALKARVLAWITPAALLVSSVCLWIALSEICVLSRAWSWIRGPRRMPTGGV